MADSPAPTTSFDLFISYARKDNSTGWVDGLVQHIHEDHRSFTTAPLRIFFDKRDITDLDDWRHRILVALQSSKILLVCLSPNYFASKPCGWEFREYLRRQVHQLMGSESIAQVYFIEVPGAGGEQVIAKDWHDRLRRSNYTDVRPWFPEGPDALQREEVKQRMRALGASLWERMERARRALSAPGNLRWQNPHFLGRTEELRLLHENLGLGRIGVVTAVQGLGGMGKTELAVAYAHSFADSYPANAAWQRDLWVSFWRLANLCETSGQAAEAKGWWRKALDTLAGMKARGLHLSPEDLGFLERLRAKV